MKKRKIWTYGYSPFTMGGNVNRPIMTEIGYIEEKSIGKGLLAFSFKTPKGTIRIAESETGAIVGESFEEVKKDIMAADKKVIVKQIEDAKKTIEGIPVMDKNEFFQMYKH